VRYRRIDVLAGGLTPFRDLGVVRRLIATVALLLAAYCLIAATTALYAQPAQDRPDPHALAARERHTWPALIPVVFLTLVIAYAAAIAARRGRTRGRAGPPSTQDPPTAVPPLDRRRDTSSR
jgi:carbon starvation protein CstA